MARLRLAVNTCFAVKHWPVAVDWLDIVARWGVSAVQFSMDMLDPFMSGAGNVAAETRAAAAERGVSIESTFTGAAAYHTNLLLHPDARYRAHALEWYQRVIEISALMGARATGGHLGALSVREGACEGVRGQRLAGLVEAVGVLGEEARAAGLEEGLLWELMPSPLEPPHTPGEAFDLLARADASSPVPVRLCYDLGHACAPGVGPDGETLYRWLEELLPVTPMLHLQQTDGLGDRHWPFAGVYQERGVVSAGRVCELVSTLSPLADVDMVLEILHPPETPPDRILDDWARSIDLWRRAGAERAGAGGGSREEGHRVCRSALPRSPGDRVSATLYSRRPSWRNSVSWKRR
jgi:sugar phosphate isomerase/epimerase